MVRLELTELIGPLPGLESPWFVGCGKLCEAPEGLGALAP